MALTRAAETELADDPLEPTELGFERRVCLDTAREPALLIESSGLRSTKSSLGSNVPDITFQRAMSPPDP